MTDNAYHQLVNIVAIVVEYDNKDGFLLHGNIAGSRTNVRSNTSTVRPPRVVEKLHKKKCWLLLYGRLIIVNAVCTRPPILLMFQRRSAPTVQCGR